MAARYSESSGSPAQQQPAETALKTALAALEIARLNIEALNNPTDVRLGALTERAEHDLSRARDELVRMGEHLNLPTPKRRGRRRAAAAAHSNGLNVSSAEETL